ncbi:uncharacterized protein LOC110806988 [Carica papaya]|uniref:uncharacterized protein LOC110806988 n=1 Tax=Carica papaya TaxID=3649 RepID=UPI000B8C866B|nr:uncharacterized protein LOC110806988 [Carica papaya]
MGKLPGQSDPVINHFSHPHQLHLSNFQTHQTLAGLPPSCSACKLNIYTGEWMYSCKICNYFLHISCSKLPQQIKHPFDPHDHVLSLLPNPIYEQGLFKCDACGKQGNGFSYHCGTCGIDLHTICATMPLIVIHHSHHHHLQLTFSPPYQNKCFCCDVCKDLGKQHWLYRCSPCGFDAHLSCARTEPRIPPVQPVPVQQTQMVARVVAQPPVTYLTNSSYANQGGFFAARPTNVLLGPGLVSNNRNLNLNQAFFQGILSATGGGSTGGGNGGGDGNGDLTGVDSGGIGGIDFGF